MRPIPDTNMLAIGQRMVSPEQALALVDLWLATPFVGGRHAPRIAKIDAERLNGTRRRST